MVGTLNRARSTVPFTEQNDWFYPSRGAGFLTEAINVSGVTPTDCTSSVYSVTSIPAGADSLGGYIHAHPLAIGDTVKTCNNGSAWPGDVKTGEAKPR